MESAQAHSSVPLVRVVVVDGDLRVVASEVPALTVGATITAGSWLGEAVVDAVHAARESGQPEARSARDDARGTYWIVQAALDADAGGEAPRARVVIVDATLAVTSNRAAVLGKLVHAMQNNSFAVQSVAEAILEEKPAGPELVEYVAHLRDPIERISSTMRGLNAFLAGSVPSPRVIDVDAFVEHALASFASHPSRPSATSPSSPAARRLRTKRSGSGPMEMSVDVDLLSQVLATLLDGDDDPVLEVGPATIDGRPFVSFAVERRALVPEDRTLIGLWDLAGALRIDAALRFSVARAIVVAHGGQVSSMPAQRGRTRLGIHLPLWIRD